MIPKSIRNENLAENKTLSSDDIPAFSNADENVDRRLAC